MDSKILDRAKRWANNQALSPEAREEIKKLLDTKTPESEKELTERFYKDLEFGTGGIRSILGMGDNRINRYTIRKATQALAIVVKRNSKKDPKVAISYDSRHFSKEFALEALGVLAANGIKSYIYKRLNPVSFLSYAVRTFECTAGIMVTASHNPPQYNGYKAFWSDGAQVTPPYDQEIIDEYLKITDYGSIPYFDLKKAEEKKLVHWIGEDFEDQFINELTKFQINPELCAKHGNELAIVFTPIHGSGLWPITKILKAYGFTNVSVVDEQASPDGRFPTVTSPNPENASALKLAVDKMLKNKADLAVGTDPDCDRIGLAVSHKGNVLYPTGNQIGLLMLHYLLTELKRQNKLQPNSYFVQSIVTTPLQEMMANHFGVKTERTLTGFKWICGKVTELLQTNPERHFLFGTEESFGYLNHNLVRDKDATGPMGLLSEIALFYKRKGMTLIDALDEIYSEYGYAQDELLNLDYFGVEGGKKIERIMKHFRSANYKEINGDQVIKLEDYDSSTITHLNSGKVEKLPIPQSNVLGYTFASNTILYLRPSGTEPKIKFYIMVQVANGTLEEKKKVAKEKINSLLKFIKETAEHI